MAIFGTAVTTAVATSVTEVYTPTSGGVQQNPTIENTGTVAFFLGSSSVTAATGLKVAPGAQVTLQGTEEAIYAITSSVVGQAVTGLATVVSVV